MKDTLKGLSENDIVVFSAVLKIGSVAEKAELLFAVFDLDYEGSVQVTSVCKIGSSLFKMKVDDTLRLLERYGYRRGDELSLGQFKELVE